MRDRIPVTLVAGFLGSGKTTLVNRILGGTHGLRVAVLVNDFGSISIDARLVVARDATTITLDNGCVCCSISADLVSQLVGLLEGPDAPEHVLVEASGVSDPGRLLVALRDPYLRRLARVDGVITLVDAAGIDEIPPQAQELARRQLASADVIVLNKVDLVSAATVEALRAGLAHPAARMLEAAHADVPLEVLLGIDAAVSPHADAGANGSAHHGEQFVTWTWSSSRPLSYAAVRRVLGSLPAEVYRAKGFLHLAEAPETCAVAHVVGRRVEIREHGPWDGPRRRSELVFVALSPGLDAAALRRRLAGAVATRALAAGDQS